MSEYTQSNESPILWVGLTNELLDPIPNQPSQVPVELSAEDAEALLDAFQHLVYSTVAISTGRSRTSDVKGVLRHQYELIVAATSVGSFFFGFRVHKDVRNRQQSEEGVFLTVTLTFTALERLSEWYDQTIDLALDIAPSAIPVIVDVLQPLIVAHGGQPINALTRDQIVLFVTAVAVFVKAGRRKNRRISVRRNLSDDGQTITKKQTDAILHVEKEVKAAHPDDKNDLEERTFDPAEGTVTENNRNGLELYIKFAPYPNPIRCGYAPQDLQALGKLNAGDKLTVSGVAHLPRYSAINAPPVWVRIKDWTNLQHTYQGQFKM